MFQLVIRHSRSAVVSAFAVAACLLGMPAAAGELLGTSMPAPATVDLTAEGTADWAHWGLNSATDFDNKATGGGQISNFTPIGSLAGVSRGANQRSLYSWSDGSPTAVVTNTDTGLRVFLPASGFSLSAPADTTSRTLTLYVGARFAIGELTASLSDSSASPITVQVDSLSSKSSFAITLTYEADSAGQTLDLSYVLESEAPNRSGWAALESAALIENGGGGVLTASASTAASTVDLTALGSDDWAHWGLTDATSFDQKDLVTTQISDYTPVNGATVSQGTDIVAAYSWTDGTPVTTATDTNTGLKVFAEGEGFSFTAEAGLTPRTLDVYLGINEGVGELTATLSDDSAAPVVVEVTENTSAASYRLRIDYSAAAEGELLTVSYTLKTATAPATAWASLESAVLVVENQPPVLDPISDVTVIEGDPLLLSVTASDVDGLAPLVLTETNTLPGSPSLITDNGDGTGQLDWLSGIGDASGSPYTITVRATDDDGAFDEEMVTVTVIAAGGGGSLAGSQAPAASNVNLTQEGVDDWVHWSLNTATEIERKAGVTPQISGYTLVNGASANRATNMSSRYSWTDGTPTSSVTNTRTGLKVFLEDKGFAFSVPADLASRTLQVYVGANRGTGELTATLSDGSAVPFTTELVSTTGKASFAVTLNYAAAADGETLDVEYILKSKSNSSSGWASLESAALVGAAVGNSAPVLTAIGDQTVTEGQQLLIPLTASDFDGPAPLVLTETNTLPGTPSIITDNGDGTGTLDWTPALGDSSGSPYSITVRAEDALGEFDDEVILVTVVQNSGNVPPVVDPIADVTLVEGDLLLLSVTASDFDGPPPLVLTETNTLPGSPGIITDNGNGTGQLSWLSSVGDAAGSPYTITVRATDDDGGFGEEMVTVTVTAQGAGSLSGGQAPAASNVDLTAQGVDDWVHWALNSATELERKTGVVPQISDYSLLNGASANRATNMSSRYSWTDGTPTSSVSNTRTGLKIFTEDKGFGFSAPADTAARTLEIYVGANAATGELTATLSDGSAAPFTTQLVSTSGKASFVVTINYAAGADGETLDIEYVLDSKASPTSGWISLESAALVGAPVGNADPILALIGDQSVLEGQQLLVPITATDVDGPAPLTITETNTLPGTPSIVTDNGDGTGLLDWTPSVGDATGSPYSVTVRVEDGLGGFDDEIIAVTVMPDGGGTLSGAAVAAPAAVNLSSVGSADWAHWGFSSSTSVDRSATGGSQISDFTAIGGANPSRATNQAISYSWSGGTPTASASNTATGLKVFTVDRGFSFTVPADTTPRTLFAYVGARNATGTVTATLSDGSAAAFTTDVVAGSAKQTTLITIDYSAASAGQDLTFEYVLTNDANPASAWISLESAALANSTVLALPYSEDFSAGAPDWIVVEDTTASSDWQAVNGVYQQNNAVGFADDAMMGAAHVGTYAYLATASMLTDYSFSVTATPTASSAQDIGVMVRLSAATADYLRLSFSGANSFGRLELANSGVFAALAKDARGVLPDEVLDIEVRVSGPVIMAYLNNQLLYGAYEDGLTGGTVGLYCRDACEFDDVLIDDLGTAPAIAIAAPTAYSVAPGTTFDVTAVVMNAPAGSTVEFDIPGASSPCGSATETSPGLFTASCTLAGDGIYTLDAELRDSGSALLASDTRTNVGVGSNYVGVGDSVTAGVDDTTAGDAISSNGFVRGVQGYQAPLTDLLEAAGQTPVVFNSGVPGDKSIELAEDRMTGLLQRHADASHLLMTIGVNDAGGASFTNSGLGCTGAACDGTFAGYVQDAVDAAVADGKTVVLAQTPPRFGDPLQAPHQTPETHPQNLLIEDEYNQVILTQITNVTAGPDFFDFFLGAENRFYLYESNLHPNALGYHAMAMLWDQVLSGSSATPFFVTNLCVRDTLGGSCEAPLSYKQNLLETDGELFVDSSDTLVSAPAVLDDGRWILTADADLNRTNADYLEFDVPGVADVYVAYDDAATTIPAWLASYTATADLVTTTGAAAPTLRLYRSTGVSGTVTLGGADAATTGAGSNYLVIVVD